MRKIYISGAITGVDNYLEHFNNAEKFLKFNNFEVINPARVMDELPKSTSYEEYMDMSICMLKMCDTIYMLNGWENSKGANREYGFALGNNYDIWKEEKIAELDERLDG